MITNPSFIPKISLQTFWAYDQNVNEYVENEESVVSKKQIVYFFQHLPLGATILDIGCGSGRDAKILCDNGFKVIGIDFAPNMIFLARKTAPLANFSLMNIENMTFFASSMDAVWANRSLLHIKKQYLPSVFSDIYKFLKLYGIFSLIIQEGEGEILKSEWIYDEKPLKFWAYYTITEIHSYLTGAKFKILETIPFKKAKYASGTFLHILATKENAACL